MEDIILKSLATKKTKEFILAHPEYRLTIWQRLRLSYFKYLKRQGWSIAHIRGHKEFFGLDFLVNKHTLIPRPETEMIIEEIRNLSGHSTGSALGGKINKKVILIDVGTGTGCIPIAAQKILDIKNIKILAIDNSRSALRITKKNAKKHDVNINFLHSDLLTNKKISQYLISNIPISHLVITANLPYLTAEQFANEPSIQREPKNALVASNHGLELYEKLLKQINILISNIKYSNIYIFLEIDPSQSMPISKIIHNLFPNATVQIKNDLAGRDRLVVIHIN